MNDIMRLAEEITNEQNSTGNQYRSMVDMYVAGKNVDTWDQKIDVAYILEIEFRSWGIKGIELYLTESLTASYIDEDGNDKEIVLLPDQIDIEWTAGGIFAPTNLDVYLNEDGTVSSATLTCSYITKE